jgi:hypothetical protein
VDTRRDEAPPSNAASMPDDTVVLDAAVFAIERVPRQRGGKRAGAILITLAALTGAGVLGNRATTPEDAAAPAPGDVVRAIGDTAPALGDTAAAATRNPAREWTGMKNGDDRVDLMSPALLSLDARASGGFLFVDGDVYPRGAMLVVVSVSDDDYHTLDVRSLNMPGGSTAFGTSPNDRFSLAIELDDGPSRQPAWVRVDAYDHYGAIIASARAAVGTPTT